MVAASTQILILVSILVDMRFLAALKIRVLQDTHKRNIAVVTRSDIFPLSMTLRKRKRLILGVRSPTRVNASVVRNTIT